MPPFPHPRPVPASAGALAVALLLSPLPARAQATARETAPARETSSGQPAHRARVSEEVRTIPTYPFSEPNPVPILVRDARLYPYHAFDGYSATPEPREWKVVRLENDWIEVLVLPEVGGKVWGARVKSDGYEFIYRNDVLKFRNIALRGPWTSGGIEFNFGVVGHTPSTATPVDYTLRENPDGSASCWIGAMDLPSRTPWRVEIRLPADRAYFETRVFWSNPTPLEQPYYSWMTAAAAARADLEMTMPGTAYLRHPGDALPWPVDAEGRDLSVYRNNDFGGHKSYHVVGALHDFFGGYYRDADRGFGHWAPYEDLPGQKLWLWSLSREGGIWEDLLTDADGQYVEFQAGRLFVQYTPDGSVNPITQAGFPPLSSSRWSETWFPVEGLGGLSEASREGALHVVPGDRRLSVSVHAFGDVTDTLEVWSNGERVMALQVSLEALEPFHTMVQVDPDRPWIVRLPALGLEHRSDPSTDVLTRPWRTDPEAWASIPEADRLAFQARELARARRNREARDTFDAALAREPWHREALLGRAVLDARSGAWQAGLIRVDRVRRLDAYDPDANFLAGVLSRALGRTADARDALAWAARSPAYGVAARVELAELALAEGEPGEARRQARRALEHDRASVPAWHVLAVVGRTTGDASLAEEAARTLLELDPLHHFVDAEAWLAARGTDAAGTATGGWDRFPGSLGGEFPDQTLLELAVEYTSLGRPGDARALLERAAEWGADHPADGRFDGPVLGAWRAWLADDPSLLPGAPEPDFAFPFRPETLPILAWAADRNDTWTWRWLFALDLWAVGRETEAADLLAALGQEPDFGPFYAARGLLLRDLRGVDPAPDLRRAVALDPGTRILHVDLARHLLDLRRWDEALVAAEAGLARFGDDADLALLKVRGLLHVGRATEAADVLGGIHVLPSENARESHRLWVRAHTLAALDAMEGAAWDEARRHVIAALEWPESLGQGRPYRPEERLPRFLLGRIEDRLGHADAAQRAYRAVLEATPAPDGPEADPLALLAVAARAAVEGSESAPEAAARAAALADRARRLLPTTTPEQALDARILLRALAGEE